MNFLGQQETQTHIAECNDMLKNIEGLQSIPTRWRVEAGIFQSLSSLGDIF